MLIFLALALTVFIGMTGLGVDFAFSTLERRALQNAADASAVTGARNLSIALPSIPDSDTIARRNATMDVGGTGFRCQYVNASNVDIGVCDGSMIGASGVHVTTSHTRETYFIRAARELLGQPPEPVTISADAIALIKSIDGSPYNASNALFIVCGYDTTLVGGGTLNILQGASPGTAPWRVNPAAYGKEFIIHGTKIAMCGVNNSQWKGLNGQTGSIILPNFMKYKEGTVAGPASVAVDGTGGCSGIITTNCVMILPIAVPVTDPATLPDKSVAAVRWLPFRIQQTASNEHSGVLLQSFNLNDPLQPWTYDGGNASHVTSIRVVK